MNFKDYQLEVKKTAIYPKEVGLYYTIIGLAGEAGELAGKFSKVLRDKTKLDEEAFLAELGDVLWFVASIANELNTNLEWVAFKNLEKLASRQQRNTLGGNGDKR